MRKLFEITNVYTFYLYCFGKKCFVVSCLRALENIMEKNNTSLSLAKCLKLHGASI